jgi:hypothetical protein
MAIVGGMRAVWLIIMVVLCLGGSLAAQTNRLNLSKEPLPFRGYRITGITWYGTGSSARPHFNAGSFIGGKNVTGQMKVGGRFASYAAARAFTRLNLRLGLRVPRGTPPVQLYRMDLRR